MSFPGRIVILVNCKKNMERYIVDIFRKTEETKNSQIKGQQHPMGLDKTIALIFEENDEYEREKVEREKIMKDMQKKNKDMSAII